MRIEAEAPEIFHRVTDADGAQQAHRHQVERLRQRAAQPRGTVELAAVVLRAPFLLETCVFDHNRRAAHGGRGREALLQRRGINERLDARSRLAFGLDRAVVVAFGEIEAADQRQHRAILRAQGDKGAAHARNLRQAPVAALGVFRRFEINDVTDAHHVRGALGRGADGILFDIGTRPGKSGPIDGDDHAVLGVHAGGLLLDGEHDAGHEFAHGAVVLQRFIQVLAVRLPVYADAPDRPAIAVPALVFEQPATQRAVRRTLVFGIERRVDMKTSAIGLVVVLANGVLTRHFGDVGRLDIVAQRVFSRGERCGQRALERGIVDVVKFLHLAQHVVAPLKRVLGIGQRVIARRRLRQASKLRRFREREFRKTLAVIHLRRRGEAVGAVSKKDLVDVQHQDFFFREFALDFEREQYFFEFARVGFFRTQEIVARHLHGDGAAALAGAPGAQVVPGGARDAEEVHALVIEERMILGRQDGMHQLIRDLLDGDRDAFLLAELGDEFAVRGVYPHRDLKPPVGEVVDGG